MAVTEEDFDYDDAPLDDDLGAEPSAERAEQSTEDGNEGEAARFYQRKARWYAVQVASGCEKLR